MNPKHAAAPSPSSLAALHSPKHLPPLTSCVEWTEHIYLISWAYPMRVLGSIPVCLFSPQSDKWVGKFSCQKQASWKLSHRHPRQRCQDWTEQREETLHQKAEALGCHRIVTFRVERHYDNKRSFSVTSTSWSPVRSFCFAEANGLWQSFLRCIAGLFLEVTVESSALLRNPCQSSFPQCATGCYGK